MALAYEGFTAYTLRGEGFYGEVDDLVTYIIVTCNGDTSVSAADHVTHRKGLQETVIFYLKVRGVNVITCR